MTKKSEIQRSINEIQSLQRGYMHQIGTDVIDELGRYDGKRQSNISLASHIVNTTLIGLNVYAYEELILKGNDRIDEEEYKLLSVALTLHDVNKIVSATQDKDITNNSKEALELYFEEDVLGIDSYLDGADEYFMDILYLIQRTETGENASETRGYNSEYTGLEAYCEIGDGVSSATTAGDMKDGYRRLNRMMSHISSNIVHHLSFNRTSRPFLSSIVMEEVKGELQDEYGLVICSSTTDVLYLGNPIDKSELKEKVSDEVASTIADRFGLSCKANWQSVNYGILEYAGIGINKKRHIISDEYIKTVLKGAQAGINKIESVPTKVEDNLPELLHRIYNEKNYEFQDDNVQQLWKDTKEDVGSMKSKVHFIFRLCDRYQKYQEYVESIVDGYDESLEKVLTPENSPSNEAVNAFFGEISDSLDASPSDEICFLCGQHSENDYKGNTLYGTNSKFTKRVGVEQKYKKICRACSMEESLIQSNIEESDQISDDITMVFFYYDNFVAEVHKSVRQERVNILDDTIDFGSNKEGLGVESLFALPVHIQPLSLSTGRGESDGNKKLRITRDILKKINSAGMKATISTPFRPFESERYVLNDMNPTDEQRALSLNTIEKFEDVNRALMLLQIGYEINGATTKKSPYLEIQRDNFLHIVHKSVTNFDDGHRRKSVIDYCKNYHTDSYMSMKEVAENGFELYRKNFNDSKHEKTSVFREAVESTMSGIYDGMDEEELFELVCGKVMTSANRQQDGGYEVDSELVEEFVESLFNYLEDNNLMELQKLSDRENDIVDAYYFTYEQVLSEQYGDNND